MVEEKKEEKKDRFEIVEIPTQTGFAFKDNEADETIDQLALLAQVANNVDKIKKEIVGKS